MDHLRSLEVRRVVSLTMTLLKYEKCDVSPGGCSLSQLGILICLNNCDVCLHIKDLSKRLMV